MAGLSRQLKYLILIILGVLYTTKAQLDFVPYDNPTPNQNQITYLLEGYEPILNSSVAYKLYNDTPVTWMEAKGLCEEKGARLAVADNQEIYKRLMGGNSWKVHIGIHRLFETWVSLRNGSKLHNLPWAADEPSGLVDCVGIINHNGELGNYGCYRWTGQYACELPIP